MEEKKLFAASVICSRWEGRNIAMYNSLMFFRCTSKLEAIGAAHEWAEENYPNKEGYANVKVIVKEQPTSFETF